MTLAEPNSSPWYQTYAFDAVKRLTNTTSLAGSFGYAYDATRQLQVSQLTLPNGAYIADSYDSMSRLLSTDLKNSGGTALNSHTYTYNHGSQRTSQTFLNNNYEDYTYDNIGQLTSALGAESGGSTNRWQEQLRYAYDAAHNLNIRTNNALVQTFNVNNLNELSNVTHSGTLTVAGTTTSAATSVTVNNGSGPVSATRYDDATFAATNFTVANGDNAFTAIASDSLGRSDTNSVTCYLPASNSYSYDLNGNLLSDSYRTFTYDDENELTSVVVSNGVNTPTLTTNLYDGRMRRRIRKDYIWSGAWVQTAEVHYIYDGNEVIQERDGNNLPLVSYTRGKDLSGSLQGGGGIGGLLARTDNTQTTVPGSQSPHAYYHCDGSGNVTALVDSQQYLVAKYEYDPFGNITSQSGPLAAANVYRFSSKEWDQNSGLVCYLYRFYDPNLQRWVNRDPIGEGGGDNLYGFAANSPLAYGDAEGLYSLSLLVDGQAWSGMFQSWGTGLYDWMYGDPGPPDPNSYGALRAQMLGGIDPHDNLLRDAMGGLADMTGTAVVQAALQMATDGVLGAVGEGVGSLCEAAAGDGEAVLAAAGDGSLNMNPYFEPGPFAGESIPAESSAQVFTQEERDAINEIGYDTGCHTCGTTDPGTISGNFIPDHQPPSRLNTANDPQQLYPQCKNCSNQQGLAILSLEPIS